MRYRLTMQGTSNLKAGTSNLVQINGLSERIHESPNFVGIVIRF